MHRITIMMFLCAIITACASMTHPDQTIIPQPSDSLRVASYNVNWENGIHPLKNPQANIQAMIQTRADVLLLQEATRKWMQRIRTNKILDNRYPYIIFRDHPNAGGLAVLSKYPITTGYYHNPKIGWHPKWIFTVNSPNGIIQLVNIHLSPPVVSEGHIGFLNFNDCYDRVLFTRSVKLLNLQVLYEGESDHFPVIADLRI